MLESVFVATIILGSVFFILAVLKNSIVFSGVSMLYWIIVMAGQVYVVSGGTNYSEGGMLGLALGMIFINIIWLITQLMVGKDANKYIR